MNWQGLNEVIEFLEETPEAVRRFGEGLAAEELRWKPGGEKFSLLEHVCHLRDIEREGYGRRIEKLLNESQPLLTDIDGRRLAEERRYNEQDFAAGLREFDRARQDNVRAIKGLSAEQLNRVGVFEGAGAVTLGSLILMMYEHDREHRKELGDLRERLLGRRAGGS
jgi:hypothetical protein